MIPGVDTITVAPVGRVAATVGLDAVGDARQQDFQRALAGLVGKSMPAEVISRLTDGSFLVRVADTPARMVLPQQQHQQQPLLPGAAIALTLVSLTPRPTFQLTNAPTSAAIPAFVDRHSPPDAELYTPSAGMAKAGALQRTAALPGEAAPANAPAAPDSASSQATLSAAARVISSVLGAAARSEHPQTSIVAPLPLLAQVPTDPAKLAAQLKDAIGASGLFYESHVAEWSAGKRPLAQLQREPQMQRALTAAAAPEPAQVTAPPGSAPAPAAVDPATAQFINLQLTSQEQGRVAWQGQLLPGQDMAWQISRDPPDTSGHPGAEAETAEPPWRSALRLRFAALGEIGATVVLAGDQLHIALQAGSSDIGSVLHARAGELRRALEASGNPPATLTVSVGAVLDVNPGRARP
ncbi:hypothetical protein GCM10008020_32130 [Massilia psychrophila]|nr:flagellar hook-length control protein FliK [Massilia psychrophila]GGE84890.1 hypothetical protein GCM10008020_32130 [Massilia psychrophila]